MATLKCFPCLVEYQAATDLRKRREIEPAEFVYRGIGMCREHVNTQRGHPATYGTEDNPKSRVGQDVLSWLAAIDNGLTQGSYMTGANLAFGYLCDQLGVVRDSLRFDPDWSRR